MKKLFLFLTLILALSVRAQATTVTVSANQITQLPFNPSGIGSTRTLTVSATNGSATITSSAAFPPAIVGISGFQVSIGGTQYVVASVASTSSMTLTTNYAGVTGSATMLLFPYTLFRVYATAGFQDNVTGQNVQAGTPGSGQFYKQVAVSIINSGAGNVAYMPEFTIPSTTDALINNSARYIFGFYRPDGSLLSFYTCGSVNQLAIQPNTPTTWTAICNFNSPGGVVPPNTEVYTKSQIDQRFPNCSAGQLYYFDTDGNILSCLTLGSNLSITSGVLNATGGGGGGNINAGTTGQIGYYAANGTTLSPMTVGSQLTVSGSTLKTSGVRPAINAVVDYGVVCDGATNTLVSLQNAVTAAALSGGAEVVLPAGNCRISGTLTVPGGVTLEGQGMQKTTISSVANATIVSAVEGSGAYAFLGPTIRNLRIQGSASGSSQIGLSADDVVGPDLYFAQGVFENIQISQAGSHGLYVGNAFSSRFINIYSDDNNGYPFYINSANMPSNHYESLYAQETNSTANAGFRIVAGNFICISCNGINASAAGSWNAILGQSIAQGDASNVAAFAQWQNSNFESAQAGGIDHRYNSVSTFSGHNSFVGSGGSSGSYIAMRYEIDTAIFPPYFAKGTIDGSVVFANSPVSFYTNSQPIHANDLPPLTIDGQGPKVAGGNAISTYRNTASSTSQQLYRSDAYYPTVAVTTSTSFTNPGPRYFEVTCGSNCTLTLPWPGWYQPGGEQVIVKNLSTSGIVVTLAANSGGSVNTPNGYTMTEQYQSVTLMPDSTALDYRVIGKVYPGVATRIPVYADTVNQTTISGLAWDAGSNVLTSPGRFWGANNSAGAPTFAFSSDFSTGFYLSSSGNVGFASSGGSRMLLGNTLSLLNYGASTGQTGTLSLFDLDNSASVSLRSPDTIASPFTLTLPDALPGSTLCLAFNTSGVGSYTSCAGGGVTTLAGTANQITASAATGAVTLSLAGPHNFTTATSNGVAYGNGTGALQFTAAGGPGTLCLVSTAGAAPVWGACSGSTATALSSITAASAANTVSSGDNGSQIWQWSLTTNSTKAFSLTESAASTATTSYLFDVHTLSTSTLKPIIITAGGTANGVEMSTAGSLGAIGTGAIVATTGDTATAFFSAGTIEAARGGTGSDSSGSTGIPRVSAGTWTYNAGVAQLASSTSADLRGVLSDETGTGVAVFANTPTLITPVLGVATATSINGNTFTTGTYTLTGAAAKTLTFSNTLTLAGTDGTTMTFPSTSGAVATADSSTIFTNKTYNTAGTGNSFSINGQAIATVSGNTSKVGTTGAPSTGKCLEWDANGNIITAVNNLACGGAITSVTANNATLTISPTTGAVLAELNLANANTWTALQTLTIDNATTNAVSTVLDIQKSSSGTPAAGMGGQIRFGLESSTTANQPAGLIQAVWNIATHASRNSYVGISAQGVSTTSEVARFQGLANGVNYFSFFPSTTGNALGLAAEGSDSNVGIDFQPKGTGTLTVNTVPILDETNAAAVTNKTITDSTNVLGGVTMTLGSDANGDTYYRASGVLTRLALGTAAQCLKVNAGATAPEWGACSTSATLTSGRVGFGDGSNLMTSSANITWDETNKILTATSGSTAFVRLASGSTAAAVQVGYNLSGTGAIHPGSGGGLLMPFVGGSQSSGPGIFWTNNAYNATAGIWLASGFNIQGAGASSSPVIIRSSTSTSSNGQARFTFTPDSSLYTQNAATTATAANVDVEAIDLITSGTAAANLGIGRLYTIENASGSQVSATRLSSRWTVATAGSETSAFAIANNNAGAGLGDSFTVTADQYHGTYASANVTGAATIDFDSGNVQELTFTGNVTSTTLSNLKEGAIYFIIFKQSAGGGNTLASTNINVPGGSLTLTATANARDLFQCAAIGTELYCSKSLDVR